MKVVFLGPDGVGKSTIINSVELALKTQGIDSSYHYLVPGFLPRYRNANNGTPVTDPHAAKSHGKIKSIVKIIFWIVEYVLGGKKFDSAEKVMLFDRYFYDIIVDPKRYCYGGSTFISKLAARMIPKPTLLVILDAPTDVIQARKQEVSPDETERQRKLYLNLKDKYCKSLIIDTTNDIKSNADLIINEIFN